MNNNINCKTKEAIVDLSEFEQMDKYPNLLVNGRKRYNY